MQLNEKTSEHNFYAFLFHAGFLAFAKSFMDIDTVIPAMLVDAGGSAVQIGLMSAIMYGGSGFTQIFFAPFISNSEFKKKFLLFGINLRIIALFGIAVLLFFPALVKTSLTVWVLFFLITTFSLGGAFANVSYTDILGKSVLKSARKKFFSFKQIINGVLLITSAFAAKKVLTMNGYPENYGYMFLIAGLSLFAASIGFWVLKETVPSKLTVKSPKHFISLVKQEISANHKLPAFLGLINTLGIGIGLMPFVILYSKSHFIVHAADTGNFLLFKMSGSILTGFILFKTAGKYKYKHLLYGSIILAILIPLALLFLRNKTVLFPVFFGGGVIFTMYGISISGILLEMSGTQNRALYTGIAGAGNILPAVFPLFAGKIIKNFGFTPFFLIFMAIISLALYFVLKLGCNR